MRSLAAAARLLIGIADAGTDMTLHSAAPATILIARAFMGHSLLVCPSRNKPTTPRWRSWYHERRSGGDHGALKNDPSRCRLGLIANSVGARLSSKRPGLCLASSRIQFSVHTGLLCRTAVTAQARARQGDRVE